MNVNLKIYAKNRLIHKKNIWKNSQKNRWKYCILLQIGQLNINSLMNKFDLLAEQIKGIIDVLVISES